MGHAAVEAGRRLRYFTAAELLETPYPGLADNSVGKVIDQVLRAELVIVDDIGFALLDDIGTELVFRFVASHWSFDQWGGSCLSTRLW